MNEFTKEELQGILEALQIIDENPFIRPDIYWSDSLIIKIQSMIDNYCDHNWDNMCCGCEMHNIYCVKCDKKMSNE